MKKRIAGILIIALAVMLLSPAGQMDRVHAYVCKVSLNYVYKI